MKDRATDSLYATGWWVSSRVPPALARPVFQFAADRTWARDGRGVRQLTANLRRVVGPQVSSAELSQLVRQGMRSYLRYWHEMFALSALPKDQLASLVRFTDRTALDEAIARGAGTLVVLSHSANWDTAGAWLAVTQQPFTTVAERVRPDALYDRFVAHRRSFGIEVLAADGGHQVLARLAQRLRDGKTVCLLADRVIGTAQGVPVSFFGEAAHMPGGPASLALRTGCSLVAIHLHYDGSVIVARSEAIDTAADLPEDREGRIHVITQRMATAFEGAIAEHPTDWHMLQPLWDADLSTTAVP